MQDIPKVGHRSKIATKCLRNCCLASKTVTKNNFEKCLVCQLKGHVPPAPPLDPALCYTAILYRPVLALYNTVVPVKH